MKLTLALVVMLALMVSAEEVYLLPVQDAYTCPCQPNTTNPNGGPNYLYFAQLYSFIVNFYIQWDISGIPPGAVIDTAEMRLWCKSITGDEIGGEPVFYLITEQWDENTVTHNTMPSWSDQISYVAEWPVVGSWYSVDVTEFVQAWYDETVPNFGIIASCQNTIGSYCPGFFSSDFYNEDYRPYLYISGEGLDLDAVTWGEIKVGTR